MKTILIFLVFCVLTTLVPTRIFTGTYDYLKPKDNEIAIHYSGIELPLGRMLLIRKGTHCCALRFTRFWTEKNGREEYATYQVYYQCDGSGDFSNKNTTMIEGRASRLPLRGPFHPFLYQPGDPYIRCGPSRLTWQYKTAVGFMPPDKGMGDYGFELAPTPWTDIKEVNINDSRVKWYRYDEKRERLFIPIDKLWEHKN